MNGRLYTRVMEKNCKFVSLLGVSAKLQSLVWIKTFYLVQDNSLLQTANIISVSSIVKNCNSIWTYNLLCFAYFNSYSATVGIVMSFCVES